MILRRYGLSMLLTALAVVVFLLQAHSYFGYFNDDRWEFSTLESHYTLLSRKGDLIIYGPPPGSGDAKERQAWNDLKRLQNDQITFRLGAQQFSERLVEVKVDEKSVAQDLSTLPPAEVIRPLLRGLDSPKKFASADILLNLMEYRSFNSRNKIELSGHYDQTREHLLCSGYVLDLPRQPVPQSLDERITQETESVGKPLAAHANTSMLAQIRLGWHSRFDKRIATINYTWIILPMLLWPAVQTLEVMRRRRRRRQRLCAACGYDLRANADRCPECGAAIDVTRTGFVWMD